MTNREIFESLKTAKWEQPRKCDCIMKTDGEGWWAYVGPDGTLYISGHAVNGGLISMPHGVVSEIDEIVTRAREGLVSIWHEWLERPPLS